MLLVTPQVIITSIVINNNDFSPPFSVGNEYSPQMTFCSPVAVMLNSCSFVLISVAAQRRGWSTVVQKHDIEHILDDKLLSRAIYFR